MKHIKKVDFLDESISNFCSIDKIRKEVENNKNLKELIVSLANK